MIGSEDYFIIIWLWMILLSMSHVTSLVCNLHSFPQLSHLACPPGHPTSSDRREGEGDRPEVLHGQGLMVTWRYQS